MEINTVGELKRALEDYPDDMPVWLGNTVIEGGLSYYGGVVKYYLEVTDDTVTFGIALPPEKQRTEHGVVIF
jgi:hypothetical protein